MRLFGADTDCRPLLELGRIQRQLRLGPPVHEGTDTIRRVHDALRKRIEEIVYADPPTLDEPIEVVRVDRAYFVSDGHKRVAIARRAGREFIDARVSHLPSPYALTPEVEEEAIERTAREGEFRRHSGLAESVPAARFALNEVNAYGELLIAVQSYSFDRVLTLGRALSPGDGARLWYEDKYVPTVATGHQAAAGLIESMTDADIFLALHRQERAAWGSECGDPGCVADMLLAERRRVAVVARSPFDRILNREPRPQNSPALVLPMAGEIDEPGQTPRTADEM